MRSKLDHIFYSKVKISSGEDEKVAICAIMKDENDYLIEWVEYHLLIGFDYFLIYDNDSAIPISQTLKKYIIKDMVKVICFKENHNRQQLKAYADSIKYLKNYSWVAYIDPDEYIVLLKKDINIKEYLKKYDMDISAIGLNWLMFGSNGHKNCQKSVIHSYTQSCPNHKFNRVIKTLLRPSRFKWLNNPHFFFVKKGKIINARGDEIHNGGPYNQPEVLYENMRINHYFTKSKADFKLKQKRGPFNNAQQRDDSKYQDAQKEDVQNRDIVDLIKRIHKIKIK